MKLSERLASWAYAQGYCETIWMRLFWPVMLAEILSAILWEVGL